MGASKLKISRRKRTSKNITTQTTRKSVINAASNLIIHRSDYVSETSCSLAAAQRCIEALEAYSMRPDIIISGLPMSSFAEAAASTDSQSTTQSSEYTEATEAEVIKLFNEDLNIAVTRQDISAVHRLPKRRKDDMTPAPVIVRFTNLRTRDTIYRARLALKARLGLYINPLDARRQYTDFAQTSLRRQNAVYRQNGLLPHAPEDGIPAARCITARRRKMVYNLCFLMHTGLSIPESYRHRQHSS